MAGNAYNASTTGRHYSGQQFKGERKGNGEFYRDPRSFAQNAASEVRLPRPQRAFFGRVRRAMMEAIQVIGKSQ